MVFDLQACDAGFGAELVLIGGDLGFTVFGQLAQLIKGGVVARGKYSAAAERTRLWRSAAAKMCNGLL